jgi:hypothetical protein
MGATLWLYTRAGDQSRPKQKPILIRIERSTAAALRVGIGCTLRVFSEQGWRDFSNVPSRHLD